MNSIWQAIRMHFGFQSTGGHFLDFCNIKLEPEERPEDLFQRLMAFVDDNLLTANSQITHHGEVPIEDEEMSPTLENMIVLTWLRLLHKDLPHLVKQRYGTELRSRTLASIKPEISQALDSLLEEVISTQDAKVYRSMSTDCSNVSKRTKSRTSIKGSFSAICPICKQSGRSQFNHFLSKCPFLPERDRKFIAKARIISAVENELSSESVLCSDSDPTPVDLDPDLLPQSPTPSTRRVQIKQSPYIMTFYNHHQIKITVDSGAEVNMVKESVAVSIGAPISKSSQIAYQADGVSPLQVAGETKFTLSRDNHSLILEALVVRGMDCDVLGGVPFMVSNNIGLFPRKREVVIGDDTYQYGCTPKTNPNMLVCRSSVQTLRAPSTDVTLWPGEFMELNSPITTLDEEVLAIEPLIDSSVAKHTNGLWPLPDMISSVGGKIRIPNTTSFPIKLSRNEHFGQIRLTFTQTDVQCTASNPVPKITHMQGKTNSCSIILDPDDILQPEIKSHFLNLHVQYDSVFNSTFGCYNGASGPFEAVVNMGPVLRPQRKGRIPQYSRQNLELLQQKLDDLEMKGVFARPQDIHIVPEYLNPSFLVKKSNGGFRLVTAFTEVGRYCKPKPSLMPDVDSTLRTIAKWKYIICTDLLSAFYQIPLSRASMKYCGICTPFKGVRVYQRSAMGMPDSETALEEMMCKLFGDLIQEGHVAKIADDVYIGGNTPEELLKHWTSFLSITQKNNITLSPSKIVIAPKHASILRWEWCDGTIRANQHRVATLTSCPPPSTVKSLRAFIGAYKILSRVIPGCSHHLSDLETEAGGRQSQEKISWLEKLLKCFHQCQKALQSNKSITLPRVDDQLWIVTDGSMKHYGLGATLYVTRVNHSKPILAGFFSAKLRKRQVTWIPSEIEALSISSAIKHFSPYIVQSKHTTIVLTDSKPCVEAYRKLGRGEFSNSARVSTYLSSASRYQVLIQHLSGSAKIPSDFASRNAPICTTEGCNESFNSRHPY